MKNIFKFHILVFALIFFSWFKAISQDFHHSMYFNSPVSFNPAYAGKMQSDYRVTLLHRNQWSMINAPFKTTTLGLDINFPDLYSKLDNMGAGLVVINDELGNSRWRNNYVMGTVSGHKVLDARRRHRVSMGIQAGWVRKSINTNNLRFGNQFNNYQYNPNISSNENLAGTNINYFNLNTGFLWDFLISPKLEVSAGLGFFNTVFPDEVFINPQTSDDNKNLNMRYVFNSNLAYQITERVGLEPLLMYMHQQKASQINTGLLANYKFPGDNKIRNFNLYIGGMYRTKDAFIALTGFRYDHYEVAFSYDFTSSSLNDIKNLPVSQKDQTIGAFEISLKYLGFLSRSIPHEVSVPCKVF